MIAVAAAVAVTLVVLWLWCAVALGVVRAWRTAETTGEHAVVATVGGVVLTLILVGYAVILGAIL